MLKFAYTANIAILTPVLLSLMKTPDSGNIPLFENLVAESNGLRLLVSSLWAAILICSFLGLVWPQKFVGILVLQIIYKTFWIILFILPLWLAKEPYPVGIFISFVGIVLIWPFIIWNAWS